MGISKDSPIRNNKDIVDMFNLVMHGFNLHTFVFEGFAEEDPKYGELAGNVVALLGLMMLMEREHPELKEQFEEILAKIETTKSIAMFEIKLTHFFEMEKLGLI